MTANDQQFTPPLYHGVMVSSTFKDLVQHRAALIKAIDGQDLKSVVMENDSARLDGDLINSSLRMVRDSSAYIAVISHKYGQVPDDTTRNPDGLSLTELEFNEAQRLGRPVFLFIMGEEHPVKRADVETDPEKLTKLDAFRERAKRAQSDSSVQRVYKEFNSLEEFVQAATQSVARLWRFLDEQARHIGPPPGVTQTSFHTAADPPPIPKAPEFYAEPRYIGSHDFLGRASQLETLSDWARPADSHPILLFEAIGGTGKSMLTWEWTINHATKVRDDWAGRFWYSFYERGAVMADFCQRALAYMTGQALDTFRGQKTAQLVEQLLRHLQARPWLLILDGLERVLVAYHRFDASQLADERAGRSDQIASRNPCAAIRPEDDDLLRSLAAAAPSKLLLTSRLTPQILINRSSQPIPGVLRVPLPGLRPEDAEALLHACDVTGTSSTIQSYLQRHCDCHPLVTGVVAGLVNDYLPDRGNFDAWATDPLRGGWLNLSELNLVQKRNHILETALAALPEKSRELLSTLALLSGYVDYETLSALNPHVPPELEEVPVPKDPEDQWNWRDKSDRAKAQAREAHLVATIRRLEYEQALIAWQRSPELLGAPMALEQTVHDLERRGLLQYDRGIRRYDLHPVVRGVAAGRIAQPDKEQYGQRVVDHFTQQAHNPYQEAETLDDVRNGLHIVRTLLQMGRYEQAYDAYKGELAEALAFNLEDGAEQRALLRPFFPSGWAILPPNLDSTRGSYLASTAAIALRRLGESDASLAAYEAALHSYAQASSWTNLQVNLSNIADLLYEQGRLAQDERCRLSALNLATLLKDNMHVFCARLDRFRQLASIGRWDEAEAMWRLLDPMGRDWSRTMYRPGQAERVYALFRFWQGSLQEDHLAIAEKLAQAGRSRFHIRGLHRLRGEWELERSKWELAATSLRETIRMAREVGQNNVTAEAMLALAKFHLGQLEAPRQHAEQLSATRNPAHRPLAELWMAIGDREQAKKHALVAYRWAWADGEPYVHRYELNKATALLKELGLEIPNLPPHDLAEAPELPWEAAVESASERLRGVRY